MLVKESVGLELWATGECGLWSRPGPIISTPTFRFMGDSSIDEVSLQKLVARLEPRRWFSMPRPISPDAGGTLGEIWTWWERLRNKSRLIIRDECEQNVKRLRTKTSFFINRETAMPNLITERAFWRGTSLLCLAHFPGNGIKPKTPVTSSVFVCVFGKNSALNSVAQNEEAMEACPDGWHWSFSGASSFVDRRSSKHVHDNVHGNIYLDSVSSRALPLPSGLNFVFLRRIICLSALRSFILIDSFSLFRPPRFGGFDIELRFSGARYVDRLYSSWCS